MTNHPLQKIRAHIAKWLSRFSSSGTCNMRVLCAFGECSPFDLLFEWMILETRQMDCQISNNQFTSKRLTVIKHILIELLLFGMCTVIVDGEQIHARQSFKVAGEIENDINKGRSASLKRCAIEMKTCCRCSTIHRVWKLQTRYRVDYLSKRITAHWNSMVRELKRIRSCWELSRWCSDGRIMIIQWAFKRELEVDCAVRTGHSPKWTENTWGETYQNIPSYMLHRANYTRNSFSLFFLSLSFSFSLALTLSLFWQVFYAFW